MFGWVYETMTVSPNSTMLPPIWVAACDSQRRRNDGLRKTASAPSPIRRPSAASRRPLRRRSAPRIRSSGPRPAAGVRGPLDDRGVERRRRRARRTREAPLERRALEQHVPATGPAAQPDVRAEPVHEPGVATARVASGEAAGRRRAAGSGRVGPARRTGYQSRGRPWLGTSSRSVAGTSTRSSGVTSTTTSGWVAASWAMIPPDRVSDPVSLSGRPDRRRARTDRRAETPSTVTAPAAPDGDDARHEPDGRRSPSPRRRRCAAR